MTPVPDVQGYRGTLLFGQQDPGGPSFAQVIVAIKPPEVWPLPLFQRHGLPPPSPPSSSIRNQSGRRKPQSLGYFCSNVQRFAFLE